MEENSPVPFDQMSNDRIGYLWAKWKIDEDGTLTYHPLICHMIDSSCVVECMWREGLPKAWKERLADELDLDQLVTQQWLMLMAGWHDIGKASPGFQTQLYGKSLDAARKLLRAAGLPDTYRPWVPHALVSALALKDYYAQAQPNTDEIIKIAMSIIGGHHGSFPSPSELRNPPCPPKGIGQGTWKTTRIHLMGWLADLFDIPKGILPQRLSQATALRLAGLISVADWIASSAKEFPFVVSDAADPQPIAVMPYLQGARDKAHQALNRIGWLGWATPSSRPTFATLFPGREPRDLQRVIIDIAPEVASPAIVIIEAPMGEGKTEAAMYLADHWCVEDGGRGIFFGLPTQATTNSMFERVRDFLSQRFPENLVTLNLLHGHASLSSALEELQQNDTWLLNSQPMYDGEKSDEVPQGAVIATEWFVGGKRALLAPFGVGTIDQGLLAALSVKHGFVRHLGLSTKTVILDEVHSYDVYMTTLIERLIEWLGAHATPVVLLSATLPKIRRERLSDAYARGAQWTHVNNDTLTKEYPRVSWATATSVEQRAISPTYHTKVQLEHLKRTSPDKKDADEPDKEDADTKDGEMLGDVLLDRLNEGGCAAVICTTVQRAQRIFRALQKKFSDPEFLVLDLLHARYPYEDRMAIEQRILQRFGKDGPRPKRTILVATQVIEQSLDLDFDLMVTDLAPVDLILQRLGRLHRHQRPSDHNEPRPASLTTPTCYLLMPSLQGECPIFARSDTFVYDAHILLRSWLELRHKRHLDIPEDIETLIENVYGEQEMPTTLPPALQHAWRETYDHMVQEQKKEEAFARDRYIHDPATSVSLAEIMRTALEEDRPDIHPAHQALTRNAEPSISIICLGGTPEHPQLRPGGEMLDLKKELDFATIRKLLLRSVTISHRDIVTNLKGVPSPQAWHKVALLRFSRPVYFGQSGKAQVGKYTLHLDPVDPSLGIVISSPHTTN